MKKVIIRSAGGHDKLEYIDAPDLNPKNDEVLVKVHASGVNYADVCVRLGVYESAKRYVGWPITPGFEVSGTVDAVGESVTKFKVGDKVMAFSFFDSYASQVCVKEDQVLAMPEDFSMSEAAGFLAVFFTAFHALHQHAVIRPGGKVLIHSAAGGVGSALVQLCKAHGLFVIGVIGSSHKKDYLQSFGPDKIIDKSKEDLWAKVKEYAPDGLAAAFDANGFSTMKESYNHLAPIGKLIVYGSHDLLPKQGGKLNYIKAGLGLLKTPRFLPLEMMTDNKGVIGFNLSFLFAQKEMIQDCINGLDELLKSGKIRPLPAKEFNLSDVAEAHKFIESGKSVGKIVLRCQS